jgi:hypothetical protein
MVLRADEITIVLQGQLTIRRGGGNRATFSGPDLEYLAQAGEPAIPFRTIKVLLPPQVQPASVNAVLLQEQMQELSGRWEVPPVPPPATWRFGRTEIAWPPGKTIVNGRDAAIYSRDTAFPADLAAFVRSGQLRDWKLAHVAIALVRYNPVSKKLYRLSTARLTIRFATSAPPQYHGGRYADPASAERVKKVAVNFSRVAASYRTTKPLWVAKKPVYLVVTTRQIAGQSKQLNNFAASKKKRGFRVFVITEEVWGGGRGDVAAERLRAWLRAQYVSATQVMDRRNIAWDDVPKYVLLIGNPHPDSGDLPMKMLWPIAYDCCYNSPSDFYYADLTGNWDMNGNGRYGELDVDFGPGGVDRYAELLVGRIPFYGSVADLDRILAKIVLYENAGRGDASWRSNVLLPMKPSDGRTPGYQLGEEIKEVVLAPKGWGYHRVYDSDYGLVPPPETVPVTATNVAQVWRTGAFGATFWWTHGWSQGAADIIDIWLVATLDDARPSFTFQASCSNSLPEDSSNLTYSLLKNGGISTIGATRVSWYWIGQTYFAGSDSNSGFTFEYAKRLIRDGMESGEGLFDMKEAQTPSCPEMWMNYTGFNLYGDPSLGLFTMSKR